MAVRRPLPWQCLKFPSLAPVWMFHIQIVPLSSPLMTFSKPQTESCLDFKPQLFAKSVTHLAMAIGKCPFKHAGKGRSSPRKVV